MHDVSGWCSVFCVVFCVVLSWLGIRGRQVQGAVPRADCTWTCSPGWWAELGHCACLQYANPTYNCPCKKLPVYSKQGGFLAPHGLDGDQSRSLSLRTRRRVWQTALWSVPLALHVTKSQKSFFLKLTTATLPARAAGLAPLKLGIHPERQHAESAQDGDAVQHAKVHGLLSGRLLC